MGILNSESGEKELGVSRFSDMIMMVVFVVVVVGNQKKIGGSSSG